MNSNLYNCCVQSALSEWSCQLIFLILGSLNSTSPYVRIVDRMGNVNTSSGRVEVWSREWGTVCDDHADKNNHMALIVCRMLGFDSGKVRNQAFFGQASGPILMGNVRCTGNETSLFDCSYLQCNHNCSHDEDIGVDCYNGELFSTTELIPTCAVEIGYNSQNHFFLAKITHFGPIFGLGGVFF